MASSQTKLGKLGLGSADPVTQFMRFVEFDPGIVREQRSSRGTAGTFYTDANLNRDVRVMVTPTLQTEPTSLELAFLLAWGLGPPSTNVYSPQVAVEARNLHWKPVVGEELFMSGVGVDNLTISANVGEIVNVSLDCVGMTYDATRTDFPAITPDVTSQPFVLSDLTATGGAFSYGGSTRQPTGLNVRVRNFIDRNRYLNSLTLTRVQKMDQEFEVSFDIPSGDNASSFWETGNTSAAFLATFENIATGSTFTISAPAVRFPSQSPRHAAGGEGMITVNGRCFRTGGTGHPLTMTLDQS